MLITCPQCEFARNVPDEKLPANASLATCPKCGHKFRFREPPAASAADADGSAQAGGPAGSTHAGPNTAPEGTSAPSETPAGADASKGEASPKPKPPYFDQPARDDIWRKLEAMGEFDQSGTGDNEDFARRMNEDAGEDVPWEETDRHGFFPALWQTVQAAMFHPVSFFRGMRLGGWPKGYVKPLTFYILLLQVSVIFQNVYAYLGVAQLDLIGGFGNTPANGLPEAADPQTLQTFGVELLKALAVAPVFFSLLLLVLCCVYQLMFRLLRAGDGGFEATFRAMTYGVAPSILAVIPFVGPAAAGLWSLVVTVVAYKELHRTSYWRVVAGLLLPAAIFLTLVVLAGLFGQFGGPGGQPPA